MTNVIAPSDLDLPMTNIIVCWRHRHLPAPGLPYQPDGGTPAVGGDLPETTVTGWDCAPDRMLELSRAGPEQVLDKLVKRLEWLRNE